MICILWLALTDFNSELLIISLIRQKIDLYRIHWNRERVNKNYVLSAINLCWYIKMMLKLSHLGHSCWKCIKVETKHTECMPEENAFPTEKRFAC